MKKHNALLAAIIILMLPGLLFCMEIQDDSVYVPETQATPFTHYRTPFTSLCSSFMHSRITTRTAGTGLILAGGASLYFAKPKTKTQAFLVYLASFTAIASGTMVILHPDKTLDLCLRKPIEIGNQVGRLLRACTRRKTQQPDQMADIRQKLLSDMASSRYKPVQFEPIRERAMKDFRERVIPYIKEQFTATTGASGGSAVPLQISTAEKDLSERLDFVEHLHDASERRYAQEDEQRRQVTLANFLINQQRLNMLESYRARIATENVIIELLRILCKAFQ